MSEAIEEEREDAVRLPDLAAVIGAMVFASREPLTVAAIRKVLAEVAASDEGSSALANVRDSQIRETLEQLAVAHEAGGSGLRVVEFTDGFSFQTAPECSPWLRALLGVAPKRRLTRPALETLAIIAYRQPASRAEIEGVRGVGVDHILRTLLELQLIRIVGRSELPGRPLLYGTTQHFLDHFGLKSVRDLPGIEQLSRAEADRIRAEEDARRVAAEMGENPEAATAAASGSAAAGAAAGDAANGATDTLEAEPQAVTPEARDGAVTATVGEGGTGGQSDGAPEAADADDDEDEEEYDDEDDDEDEDEQDDDENLDEGDERGRT